MADLTGMMQAAAGGGGAVAREAIFTDTSGPISFVVPVGITSISAVCIGGGGGGAQSSSGGSGGAGGDLRYFNNLSVTSGETLTITVGVSGAGNNPGGAGGFSRIARGVTTLLEAAGGGGGTTFTSAPKNGTSSTIAGSIGGGNGGISADSSSTECSGGGGAGGYAGNGGIGEDGDDAGANAALNSGAGGGGGGGGDNGMAGPGGGVNVFGIGPDGIGGDGGLNDGDSATGGSFGDGGLNFERTSSSSRFIVNSFGGGGGGADNGSEASDGGQGAVRILVENSQSFPSTNTWMSDIITTVIESQSSASGSITIPASALLGDLAVLVNMTNTIGVQSNPAGWIRIVNQEAAGPIMTVWYRIIQSGDAGTSVTMTGGSSASSEIILFRKATGTISSVTVSGETIQSSSGIPTTQTQTVTTAAPTFITFGVFASSISTLGSGDMFFTGGLAGSGNVEPSAVFTGGNGDTSRQVFIRFRIYDSAPETNLSVVCRRDTNTQTMASFIMEVN